MIKTYSLYTAALLLLAGCSADDTTLDGSDSRVAIGVAAAVTDGDQTRAADNVQVAQFDQGETFYVFFPDGKATVANARFTTINGNGATELAEGSTAPFYADYTNAAATVTLHAYYPQTINEGASAFTVEADQTSNDSYKRSDLMYANAVDFTRTGTDTSVTIPLLFSHKLAKLTVIVRTADDISNVTNVSIISGNRTINITDGTTCTLGTSLSDAITADAPLTVYNDATGTKSISCAAVLPPQAIDGNFVRVTTASDGTAYYSTTKTLVSGHNYTIVLNVSRAAVARTYCEIGDWGEPTEEYTDPEATMEL